MDLNLSRRPSIEGAEEARDRCIKALVFWRASMFTRHSESQPKLDNSQGEFMKSLEGHTCF